MDKWTTPEIRETEFSAEMSRAMCACGCAGGAGAGAGSAN
ncbi:StsA family sactipeptide RiPP [Micromonospora wenchangensis]